MKFEIIKDYDYIYDCLTQPHVWRMSADDSTPTPGLLFIPLTDSFIWINADGCGTILLIHNQIKNFHEIHIAIKQGIMGAHLTHLMKESFNWMYDHIADLTKMVAIIPEFNHKAMGLARRLGFEYQGIDNDLFIKNGIPYKKHIYIFNKEMLCRDWQR